MVVPAQAMREVTSWISDKIAPGTPLIACAKGIERGSHKFMTEVLAEAARNAHKRLHLIEKRMQASDHPILLGMPESYYLKCFILRVVK